MVAVIAVAVDCDGASAAAGANEGRRKQPGARGGSDRPPARRLAERPPDCIRRPRAAATSPQHLARPRPARSSLVHAACSRPPFAYKAQKRRSRAPPPHFHRPPSLARGRHAPAKSPAIP
ncbi:hypothetical protein FA95DRAFT_931649 [Auriscalpium vulgare]|uniref:Uncharacterized protein n=1 Tax=Auriscalpium vulgare TaxID=40419 RepID=A0ACB8SAB3_9AGAM|nr:hypothetical protein FA95DRAFT_931649 [Auriscalpium vulgare]